MNKLAVTDRGKVWEITNSIFVVFTFFLGFANWVAFLYCSWLVKCKKWRYYALLYASPLILTIIIGRFTDLTFYGMIISGIISIIHIFKIREEVLIRYDRRLKDTCLDEVDINKLINDTRINSENTPSKKETFYDENKNTTIIQNSENVVSNESSSKNREDYIKDDESKSGGRIIDF